MIQQRMQQLRTNTQAGFTLIELIVVMVILGILAATALPRFVNLGGDARVASLNGGRGALASTVAMTRGRWLATGGTPASVVVEDTTVPFDAFGYPTATAALLQAAGITANDYTIVAPGNATAGVNGPVTSATQIAFIPRSVANSATAATCFIMYTAATGATAPATISNAPTVANCGG